MIKPRHAAEALPHYNPRSIEAWLRGERNPPIAFVRDLLEAFPERDARWLVSCLAAKREARS